MQKPYKELLQLLWLHISNRRRKQYGLLLILMIFGSFAEVLSISAVLPFLAVLVAPEKIFENPLAQPLIQILEISEPSQLLLPLTIIFGLAVIIANSMRLLLLWVSTRLSLATGADIGIGIYQKMLYQPYSFHCSRNSSEIISGITSKSDAVIFLILTPILSIINSVFVMIAILIALFVVDPAMALIAVGSFSIIYGIMFYSKRNRLTKDSIVIANESTNLVKALQEGLGGIRDVLLDGSQEIFRKIYRQSDLALRHAQGNTIIIGLAPRYLMEAIGMILIALFAYFLSQKTGGVSSAIPILGALALGAQRLLPVIQIIYQSLTSMKGGQALLEDALELIDQPLPEYVNMQNSSPLIFDNNIRLNKIDFRYGEKLPMVLNKINLDIKKGSKVGFIGNTGSGKSTLVDIIMGLLEASDGSIEIDGEVLDSHNMRSWQAQIAHVPQAIYLADGSIEENIAFGLPKKNINSERVRFVAKQAQISNVIESWPNQYKTRVGERGVQLSGGQRQRIGIARALYKEAAVIIFDEATSSLDSSTESSVMQAIDALSDNVTLLIIAHRLSTLKNCSQIIEIDENGIKRIGSYNEVITQSKIFNNSNVK